MRRTRILHRTRIVLVQLALLISTGVAATEIPAPLRAWTDWVLHGHEAQSCPFLYRQSDQRFCTWPGPLVLNVEKGNADFVQQWELFAEQEIQLPGDAGNWPQSVQVNAAPARVVERQGRPVLRLGAGKHEVRGNLTWQRAPEFLQLPDGILQVRLQLHGKNVQRPELDERGRLWLGRKAKQSPSSAARDTHSVRVFRKLVDGIPRTLETQIVLQVSGTDRELRMGPVLLDGFVPQHLESPIPARVEPDGSLRVQVRAGQWPLSLLSRQVSDAETFRLEAGSGGWPAEEVWSFEAQRHLRSVEVSGAAGIDPQQTAMPAPWKQLPAYLMNGETSLTLQELHRGDSDPAPDEVALKRRLLLDFDGSGYTVEDRLSGTLNRDRRLTMAAGYALGRAELNGAPQLITQMQESGPAGLELRQGKLDLLTVSRAVRADDLSAGGWNAGFRSAQATLQVPPGWEVFSVEGADRAHPTWISRWSLWDIFLVLIIGAAFARLYNLGMGALALAGVVLAYHQHGAPLFIWLNLAGVIALLRLIPESRVRSLLVFYRNLSLLALLIIALPWAVDEIRKAIYPQLERPWQVVQAAADAAHSEPVSVDQIEQAPNAPAESRVRTMNQKAQRYLGAGAVASLALEDQAVDPGRGYDPGALIQTGPGMPTWQWRQISISWNGPLENGEMLRIRYLPPAWVRAQRVLTVLLFFALGFLIVLQELRRGGRWTLRAGGGMGTAAMLLCAALLGGGTLPSTAQASEYPPPEYLEELRKRLLEPAKCLPTCADLPAVRVRLLEDALELRLTLVAAERVAVPMPQDRQGITLSDWQLVQGNRAAPLPILRDQRNVPHVLLDAGVHALRLQVPVRSVENLSLEFPLRPRTLEAQAPGWRVSGVREGRMQGSGLSLERIQRETVQKGEREELLPDPAPAFLRVERTLTLRDEWRLHTRVVRVAPEQGAVHAGIPVWPGERITTPNVHLEGGEVRVALSPRQRVVAWQSVLDPVPTLTVQSTGGEQWVERWRVESDTRWHVEHDGLAPVLEGGVRRPGVTAWQPWPGEKLTLNVAKPRAVAGPTRTLESVRMVHTLGQRSSETRLHLQLRSSQGGDYEFRLPAGARLQSLSVDGATQILPQQRDQVRVPLHPGTVQAEVVWQQAGAPETVTSTPALNLVHPAANVNLELRMPTNRWLLFTGGPQIGPAVLFWGLLVVVILASVALGRIGGTPLKTWHWVLLGSAMLATDTIVGALFVIGWFYLMARRAQLNADLRRDYFNLMQIGLALLSVLAVATLLGSIPAGLLSRPDMQIVGNGSGTQVLRWYQDFSGAELPAGWVFSVPMWVYRMTMLAWSLWLATALLQWLRWAWTCYSTGGLWRRKLTTASPVGADVAVEAVQSQPSVTGKGEGAGRGEADT